MGQSSYISAAYIFERLLRRERFEYKLSCLDSICIKAMLKQFLTHVAHWLFPATCLLCNAHSDCEQDLCKACAADLPRLQNTCLQCALPLAVHAAVTQLKCGNCLRFAPYYDTTIALWNYQEPVAQLVTHLKFHHQLKYARLLGELLTEELLVRQQQGYVLPEVIIPVPLHVSRLRERGFNQSLEIARFIAKRLQLDIDISSCQRQRATLAQSTIPAAQRKKNMHNAFAVVRPVAAKHVSIIDDVVTTGHTVNEMSKQLRKAGVQRIDIWCCARTIR